MTILKKIQEDYKSTLMPYSFEIGLDSGDVISFKFTKSDLRHLLGLQYVGYDEIRFSGSLVFQQIKKR